MPASTVARLVASRGVQCVVFNACQSASDEGPSSNVARCMVQEGVEVAIGMKYRILDLAAEIFVDTVYREIYRSGRSVWFSAKMARAAMRISNQRHTIFKSSVVVQDAITPILVARTAPDPINEEEMPSAILTPYRRGETDFVGRELDILMLETKLSSTNVLLLCGPAGCGKTLLAQHLCWWWKVTGLVDGCVVVDCSKKGGFVFTDVLSSVATGLCFEDHVTESELLRLLNQNRFLVVIDSLEAARSGNEEALNLQRASFRRFFRKIKQSLVVLVSRFDEDWIKLVSGVTYFLRNLDMKSSLQLATRQATEDGRHIVIDNRQDEWFLEQCLYLIDGNPAAIRLLMRVYCESRRHIKQLYNALTDGTHIDDICPGLLVREPTRCFLDAENIVGRFATSDKTADLGLLAPFWRTVPVDTGPYRQLFYWAKERVSKDNKIQLFDFQVKGQTERLHSDEANILFGKKNMDFDASVLRNVPSFTDFLTACLRGGFLTKTSMGPNGPRNDHYTIHPVLTLVLKQHEFAPQSWLKHVIEVAYQRFYIYRSRHWPTEGTLDSRWDQARTQLSFEFSNFITACNYSLYLKPNRTNVYQLKLTMIIIHCLSGNPRRVSVVRDYLVRFLEVFAYPLAENPPSSLFTAWHTGFHYVKNKF